MFLNILLWHIKTVVISCMILCLKDFHALQCHHTSVKMIYLIKRKNIFKAKLSLGGLSNEQEASSLFLLLSTCHAGPERRISQSFHCCEAAEAMLSWREVTRRKRRQFAFPMTWHKACKTWEENKPSTPFLWPGTNHSGCRGSN